jgi:hypothetical protein
MNADSVEEARATVDTMPLVAGGLAKYQFWPVGPLAALGLLTQGRQVDDGGAGARSPVPSGLRYEGGLSRQADLPRLGLHHGPLIGSL